MTKPARAVRGQVRGVHVALAFAAFVGVMFAVNGYFLARAISTFPGEVAPKSYLQGLAYNDTLDRRAAQRERGWRAEAGVADGQLTVRLLDRNGSPLSGLDVSASVHVGGARDASTTALHAAGPGEYVGPAPAVSGRRLDIAISVHAGGTLAFEAEKKLVAP